MTVDDVIKILTALALFLGPLGAFLTIILQRQTTAVVDKVSTDVSVVQQQVGGVAVQIDGRITQFIKAQTQLSENNEREMKSLKEGIAIQLREAFSRGVASERSKEPPATAAQVDANQLATLAAIQAVPTTVPLSEQTATSVQVAEHLKTTLAAIEPVAAATKATLEAVKESKER